MTQQSILHLVVNWEIFTIYSKINDKNCSLSIALTAMDQKLQKS